MLAWFESYLSRREQRVRFSDELSGSLRCNYGVPQGSILSAFLFVVHINDLVKCTDAVEFVMYADDTNIFTTGTNLIQNINRMNTGLRAVEQWMYDNRLTVNIDETHFMLL